MGRHEKEINVTFMDGKTATYTTGVLYGPYGLMDDPFVQSITDAETGEVLFSTQETPRNSQDASRRSLRRCREVANV